MNKKVAAPPTTNTRRVSCLADWFSRTGTATRFRQITLRKSIKLFNKEVLSSKGVSRKTTLYHE